MTLRCEYHYNSEFNTILPTKSHLYYNATLIFIHIGHDGAYFPHRFFVAAIIKGIALAADSMDFYSSHLLELQRLRKIKKHVPVLSN